MKQIFLFLLAFFLCSSVSHANQQYSPAAREMNLWAVQQTMEIQDELRRIHRQAEVLKDSEKTTSCFLSADWGTQFSARLSLGFSDFLDSVNIIQRKNMCLLADIETLEDRIAYLLNQQMKYSRIMKGYHCFTEDMAKDIDILQGKTKDTVLKINFLKELLREYGQMSEKQWKKSSNTVRKNITDVFGEGDPKSHLFLPVPHVAYSSEKDCPRFPWALGFHQTSEAWKELVKKLKNIADFSKDVGEISSLMNSGASAVRETFTDTFSPDEETKANFRARARTRANAWFRNNIEYPLQDVVLFEGSGSLYLKKGEKPTEKSDKNDEKIVTGAVTAAFLMDEVRGFFSSKQVAFVDWIDEWRFSHRATEDVENYVRQKQIQARRYESLDTVAANALDRQAIPVTLRVRRVNEIYGEAVKGLSALCGSMSSCD